MASGYIKVGFDHETQEVVVQDFLGKCEMRMDMTPEQLELVKQAKSGTKFVDVRLTDEQAAKVDAFVASIPSGNN